MGDDETALACDLLGMLAKVEPLSLRQQAYRAAIMVVEGWRLRSTDVREDLAAAVRQHVERVEKKPEEHASTAVQTRKRRRLEETLSNKIANELDVEDSDRVLQGLVPVLVKGAIENKAPLLAFLRQGPRGLVAKAVGDEELKKTVCSTYFGAKCDIGELANTPGVASCDDRSDLWALLDRAGGSLERRKAFSGLPEFAVELCGGYADAQQFLVVEPDERHTMASVGYMASVYVYVVLYGGFELKAWRPTAPNYAAVARGVLEQKRCDDELEGDPFVMELNAGDAIVLPPGYPYTLHHRAEGTIAWGLRFVAPASRCLIKAFKTHFDLEPSHEAVFAHHLLNCVLPPLNFDGSAVTSRQTESRFRDLEDRAKKARRARFRAKKRKTTHKDDQHFPTIFFGGKSLDSLRNENIQSDEEDDDDKGNHGNLLQRLPRRNSHPENGD